MLSAVFAAINAELVLMGAYVPALLDGKVHLARHDAPPRIIVWETDDTFEPTIFPGGKQRAILDVERNVTVIFHGLNRDVCEGMRHQFILALHKACKRMASGTVRAGSYKLGRGTWNVNTQVAQNGRQYMLTFSVPASITDRTWLATPGAAPDQSTYGGTQADTYAKQPEDTDVLVKVGTREDPDAGDPVEIIITKEE